MNDIGESAASLSYDIGESAAYQISKEQKEFIIANDIELNVKNMYRGKGCKLCRDARYKGRHGVYEILDIEPDIRNMIIEEKADKQIKAYAIQKGMKTLKMQGIQQVIKGNTTVEEIARVIDMREN